MDGLTLADYQRWQQEGYTVLPVVRRLVADDLTPVSALARLREDPHCFLFESVVGGEQLARYSMLGAAPREILEGDLAHVRRKASDGTDEILPGDPYSAVRDYLGQFKRPTVPGLPRFCGGLVGYFSYDSVRLLEHLPNVPPDPLGLPDILLARYDTVVVFDNSFNHLLLITHIDCRAGGDIEEGHRQAQAELDRLQQRLEEPLSPHLVQPTEVEPPDFHQHTDQATFEARVRQCQEYIAAGDIFQVVPSLRLTADLPVTPFQVYRSVRSLNPSPYMFHLRFGDNALVGASPEIMVRVEDGQVHLRPIAGTIHRGATAEEDEELGKRLLADEKEVAEHVMLIDLGRNDVGRVAAEGTVELVDRMVIERYSHVQHIVSHVQGRLREDADCLDALRYCHPAGTVSGAPKIRAMEIIDEMEPVKRGPYAGAVGYIDYSGTMDTCIALRTAVLTPGQVHVQAGAGVVADSVPSKEYQECLNKARAMLLAIARAHRF